MRILISKGVDVNSQNGICTPLMCAAGLCQSNAVKVFLEHNADPNIVSDEQFTALSSAVVADSLLCLELLIQAGANLNVTAHGATPLHIAAHNGSLEIIKCFLKAGADPNAPEVDGYLPVQIAASRGIRNAVKILLPVTTKIYDVPKWTVDGIIKYMQSPAAREQMKTDAKNAGNYAFKQKDYMAAIDAYSQASSCDPTDGTLLSNRSLCWLLLGQAESALIDAKSCRRLKLDWPKACYREGAALRYLQRFDEAANVFYEGMMLAPENKELLDAYREAVEAGKKFRSSG